ncbi:MAG: peptidylprolyl isomerase [Bacteroidales bacterium]|nr:peptidylprolyl isomerase [Bacteroidales bacterium]
MKQLTVLLFVVLFSISASFAQSGDDPVLITIAGEKVTKSEFLAVYQKNNVKNESLTKENVDAYLELFINYKLKVREAEALGLDTLTSFTNELSGYRRQLARPYLSNREVTDKLLDEAYERMQYDIRASHILIKVSSNASPVDTMAAYNKAMSIRRQILAGASFDEMARKYSEDPSAQDRPASDNRPAMTGNGGDLGYFTVLNLVYKFENAAYTLNIGEISMPVRTPFGYHLIKVVDKKPAIGRVQAAHILIREFEGKEDSAKALIDEAYAKIEKGEAFEDIVGAYSDDKGSAAKGGVLPWFGSFRMTPDFLLPLYDMNPGDISEPVKTQYGWHIIKLIDKQGIGSFDEVKSDLKMRVSKDNRTFIARDKLVARLKNEYSFAYDVKVLNKMTALITDSIYNNSWTVPETPVLNEILCTIGDQKYKLAELAEYITTKQTMCKEGDDKAVFVQHVFDNFAEEKILAYENDRLEQKYPEFRALMKEYRDGILLFDLMDKKVWSKAVKDTAGLQNFYETVKENYLYENRADAALFNVSDPKAEKSLMKYLKKADKKGYSPSDITSMINTDSIPLVTFNEVLVEKGKNEYVDQVAWNKGEIKVFNEEGKNVVLWVRDLREPEPKPLTEVKGIVTAEYQNYLEKQWVEELRSKYTWKVNEDVLKSIYTP